MMRAFDGRKIRDEILGELSERISKMEKRPEMAVFLIDDDPVSVSYVGLKQKIAEQIGINFHLFHYPASIDQAEILTKIVGLNNSTASGIMIQIPVPADFDRDKLISTISADKDIDGLRYCLGLDSNFLPPVILAIEKALGDSKVDISESKIAVIGQGFLVGLPLTRYLSGRARLLVTADRSTQDLAAVTREADIIISAVGQRGLIQSDMIKEGVVLIDAGTSEVGGKLVGDVDSAAFQKASFYTPVPGGIGPATIAMLMKNLVESCSK